MNGGTKLERGNSHYPDKEMHELLVEGLENKGITLKDIALVAYDCQKSHVENLTLDECLASVERVCWKRELMNLAVTAIELDRIAEKYLFRQPLQSIIENDLGVYGVDETLALGISQLGGSISTTNYGNLDVIKTSIAKRLDTENKGVNTFIDDIVTAIACYAAARVAHLEA